MALDVHCTYIKQVQVAERQDKGKQHNDNLRGREAPRIYWVFLSVLHSGCVPADISWVLGRRFPRFWPWDCHRARICVCIPALLVNFKPLSTDSACSTEPFACIAVMVRERYGTCSARLCSHAIIHHCIFLCVAVGIADYQTGISLLVCAAEGSRESVDAKCRRLTATWVRERHVSHQDIEVCDFFEQLERAGMHSQHCCRLQAVRSLRDQSSPATCTAMAMCMSTVSDSTLLHLHPDNTKP